MAAVKVVLFSCFEASFYIYGFWLYSSEVLFYAISTLTVLAILALLIFILVHIGRIPPPNSAVVEEIFGQDMFQLEGDDSKKDSKEGVFIMKSIAHRGAGLDAPENSISAFRQAKEKGMTAVEFDVALTKDQIPIVFHDEIVDRMTDITGRIDSMTWEELKQLDISVKHPLGHKFKGERILLFEDAVKECLNLDLRMFIDLKGDDYKLVSVIHNIYKNDKRLYTRAVVSSFNPVLIYLIRRGDPEITSSMAWRPHVYASMSYIGAEGEGRPRYKSLPQMLAARYADTLTKWAVNKLYYHMLGLSAVLLHKDTVTSEVIRYWKERGLRVMPWTVNLPLEKQYFSRVLKVTYLTDTLIGENELKLS